jgi:hypothetical protein
MAAVEEDESAKLTTNFEDVANSIPRLEGSYNEGVSVKENLQKTLSFHVQYQETVTEMKSFLANAEDELNGNSLNSDCEQKAVRLKVNVLNLSNKSS